MSPEKPNKKPPIPDTKGNKIKKLIFPALASVLAISNIHSANNIGSQIQELQTKVDTAALTVQAEQTKIDETNAFIANFQNNYDGKEVRSALVKMIEENQTKASEGMFQGGLSEYYSSFIDAVTNGPLDGTAPKFSMEIQRDLDKLVTDKGPQYQALTDSSKVSLQRFVDSLKSVKDKTALEAAQVIKTQKTSDLDNAKPDLQKQQSQSQGTAVLSGLAAIGAGIISRKKLTQNEGEPSLEVKDLDTTNPKAILTDTIEVENIPTIGKTAQETKLTPKPKPSRIGQLLQSAALGGLLTMTGPTLARTATSVIDSLPISPTSKSVENISQTSTLDELLTNSNKDTLHRIYMDSLPKGSSKYEGKKETGEFMIARGGVSNQDNSEMINQLIGIATGNSSIRLLSISDQALLKQFTKLVKAQNP
jgi:hypothetical protein